jgi:hypothetical protein
MNARCRLEALCSAMHLSFEIIQAPSLFDRLPELSKQSYRGVEEQEGRVKEESKV